MKWRKPGLSKRILIGLVLGVFTGFFFGEGASGLAIVGRGYVGLLQMSILPYMVVSLIGGIGQLSYEKAGNLAITGGLILVGSWVLAFFMVFAMPLAFPSSEAGSFYSPSLVKAADVDFIDLYIPVNPFSSLARTVVPAAAVFSVAMGIALIGVKQKKPLLDVLSTTQEALTRVAMMVVQLSPFGIFAIAANAAGTMTIEEFGRLQTYIFTFVAATLVLTFWVIPGFVSVLTPFSYRDVLRASRDALITGFATGNLFIVLPLLIEQGKALFEQHRLATEDTASYVEVLVPASFNFPNIGKLLTLLFVLFAGWFTGTELSLGEYPMFSVIGLFTLFGGVDLALPFLLDQLRIPSDTYQLYVVTGVVNGWFATLLAVMNLFAFTLIATAAATGWLKLSWSRLGRFIVVSLVVMGVVIGATRFGLSVLVSEEDIKRTTLMQTEITYPVQTTVYKDIPEDSERLDLEKLRLQQIIDRGTLRVGYNPSSLPFAFFNDFGGLVGYDVTLYNQLAGDLGVKLDFVPWDYDTLINQLNEGSLDLVAGGLIVTPERLARIAFSESYMTVTMGLVVPDHRRTEFPTWDVVDRSGLQIGLPDQSQAEAINLKFAGSEVVAIRAYEDFFYGDQNYLDAIIISAEAGSAWTVVHPEYSVAIPEPHVTRPIAIAMARGDQQFVNFLDDWLKLKKTDGTLDKFYDTWILGKGAQKKQPRWSIIRDVLHWVD